MSDSVSTSNTYLAEHDVWSLAPSPHDPELLITSSLAAGETVLWRAPGAAYSPSQDGEGDGEGRTLREPVPLEKVTSLGDPRGRGDGQRGEKVAWQNSEGTGAVGTNGAGKQVVASTWMSEIRLFDLSGASATLTSTISTGITQESPGGGGGGGAAVGGAGSGLEDITAHMKSFFNVNLLSLIPYSPIAAVAFDPHNTQVVSVAQGRWVQGFDCRENNSDGNGTPAFCIGDADTFGIRDVDYNPNKPLCVATCGDDRAVRFWDIRNVSEPIRILHGHNSFCQIVRYNRFHDQLLLSAGSDSLVNLWRVSSVSSAPLLELLESANDEVLGTGSGEGGNAMGSPNSLYSANTDAGDCCIRAFGEDYHDDAVYSVAWSASDAWVFASVDYKGNVAINTVPSTEKYKILL